MPKMTVIEESTAQTVVAFYIKITCEGYRSKLTLFLIIAQLNNFSL